MTRFRTRGETDFVLGSKILAAALLAATFLNPTSPAQERDRRRGRPDNAPKVGDKAPDFKLDLVVQKSDEKKKGAGKKATVLQLSEAVKKKPVVLPRSL